MPGGMLKPVGAGQIQGFLYEAHCLDPFQAGFRHGYKVEIMTVPFSRKNYCTLMFSYPIEINESLKALGASRDRVTRVSCSARQYK